MSREEVEAIKLGAEMSAQIEEAQQEYYSRKHYDRRIANLDPHIVVEGPRRRIRSLIVELTRRARP